MAKVTITFEADSWPDAYSAIKQLIVERSLQELPSETSAPLRELIGAPEPAPEPASEPKRVARAKPSAVKASPPPEPEPEPEPVLEPSKPVPAAMPALEVLKQAVTVAVRAAQKNGGPRKILELLPDFKTETGLDFVMNAKEEHRPALFGLVQAAGLDA
jgi:hypothetical protein